MSSGAPSGPGDPTRTERELAEAVFQASGAIVIVVDPEARVVRLNPAGEALSGWRSEELRGRSVWTLALPEEEPTIRAVFERLLAGESPIRIESHLVARDGVRRLIRWSASVAHDADGRVALVVGTGIDLTDRVRAEEALREQAARLSTLAEASRAFAAGLDYKTTLDTVARRLAELMGDGSLIRVVSGDGEWLVPVAIYHPDPERAALRRRILQGAPQRVDEGITARVLRSGETLLVPQVTEAFVHEHMKPEYWPYLEGVSSLLIAPLMHRRQVFGHLSLMRDQGRPAYTRDDAALLEDLAHRAAQAIENARLYGEARAAVAARDEFLSIASHELRTPLGALRLALENMRRIANRESLLALPPAEVERVLDTAERQGDRLERLVAALLDVSRIHMGRLDLDLEEVELGAVVRDAVAEAAEEAEQTGSRIDVEGEPVRGSWDRVRVGQIVSNLLSNAVKYGAGKPVEVRYGARGGRAWLSVRDQGIGIDPKHHRHIFERFERAVSSRNYGGLGLGLYIVKRVIEAHGGSIRVESAPGQGAAFYVELPCDTFVALQPGEDRITH